MFDCPARPSSSFGNSDPFVMNQSPSFNGPPFGQLPQPSSMNNACSKIDLVNGLGNYGNQHQTSTNQSFPPFHRFTLGLPPAPTQQQQNSNANTFFQQSLAPFRTSSATPIGFTENEFPSLSIGPNRGAAGFGFGNFGQFRSNVGFGRAGYANLIKQQQANVERAQPEFQIQNEDFPALPRAQSDITSIIGKRSDTPLSTGTADGSKADRLPLTDGARLQQQAARNPGIETHLDGTVSSIPAGLLNDQFGMAGLLTFIRAVTSDPAIVSLAMGQDLTRLGVNLNTPQRYLCETFGGPWAEQPCRPHDIDWQVPPEYINNAAVCETLAPIKLNRYGEDLLFYLFYNFGGEMFQLAAAAELYNRDWRYHKEERVWVARAPGVEPVEKTPLHEKGTYYVFDPGCWRKVQKDMHLEYSKLEDRPMLPPQQQQPIAPSAVPGHVNFGLSGGMRNS